MSVGRTASVTAEDVNRAYGQLVDQRKNVTVYAIHKITGGSVPVVKRLIESLGLQLHNQPVNGLDSLDDQRLKKTVELLKPVLDDVYDECDSRVRVAQNHAAEERLAAKEAQAVLSTALEESQQDGDALREDNAALQAEIAQLIEARDAAQAALADTRHKNALLTANITALETQLAEQKTQRADDKKMQDERIAEIKADAKSTFDMLEKQHRALQVSTLAQHDKELAALKATIETLTPKPSVDEASTPRRPWRTEKAQRQRL